MGAMQVKCRFQSWLNLLTSGCFFQPDPECLPILPPIVWGTLRV